MKRSLPLESSHQIMLFKWIRQQPDLACFSFSIPNERKTTAATGYHLKQMGLMPGVSDIFIAVPRESFHGFFIELKVGKNKPTKNQLQFMENMEAQGFKTAVCYGFEQAKKAIVDYMQQND